MRRELVRFMGGKLAAAAVALHTAQSTRAPKSLASVRGAALGERHLRQFITNRKMMSTGTSWKPST
jgi:hypothetical protein